ncbi:hypothetical protein A0H76_2536 [Hepatospora eriocheir]|uniref:Mediator complex subunit 15 KIX domain-containing protein n=1 Tax=Hepatospora eriocheir TaxID=1081669 RepID=A0A1X0QF69_9MICR|nr:hypothetical protein A0H76_2536 [Hepatospora eriocheir]
MGIDTNFRKRKIIELIQALRESPTFCNVPLSIIKEAVLSSEQNIFNSSLNKNQYTSAILERLKRIKECGIRQVKAIKEENLNCNSKIGQENNFSDQFLFTQNLPSSAMARQLNIHNVSDGFHKPSNKTLVANKTDSNSNSDVINSSYQASKNFINIRKFYDNVNIRNDKDLTTSKISKQLDKKAKVVLDEFNSMVDADSSPSVNLQSSKYSKDYLINQALLIKNKKCSERKINNNIKNGNSENIDIKSNFKRVNISDYNDWRENLEECYENISEFVDDDVKKKIKTQIENIDNPFICESELNGFIDLLNKRLNKEKYLDDASNILQKINSPDNEFESNDEIFY